MQESLLMPKKLIPAFKDYLWGGEKLRTEFKKQSDLAVLAESWEFSVHPDGLAKVVVDQEEITLKQYIDEYLTAKELGTAVNKPIDETVLIKLIDAKKDLSIQVHPKDDYARKFEGDNGKTEMWVILDSDPGAFVYYGMKETVTKEQFRKAIEENTVLNYLNKVPVQKGDIIFVPAGTIHAIGEGTMLCEIQQCSNVTYRVYDFNRKDAFGKTRELHVDKALEVLNLEAMVPNKAADELLIDANDYVLEAIRHCEYFDVKRADVTGTMPYQLHDTSFVVVNFTEGSGEFIWKEQYFEFKKGDSFFIPAQKAEIKITGDCQVLFTTIPAK